ncbi:hypothetical protein FF36_06357 [Frankia torreyi]|uniref:Uncharacterized protein n=1 Tax=Frankia torreyi TaxID=1856 RepID=A0A0D8B621_9ACTN|nr:hypothetical protein [Frankia torreyi]KJE19369.1 hypothetical protein FF36_06357 [Frankia torreyi]
MTDPRRRGRPARDQHLGRFVDGASLAGPDIRWKPGTGDPPESVALAYLQHRLIAAVRAAEPDIDHVALELRLGRPRNSLRGVMNGRDPLQIEDALRIALAFDVPLQHGVERRDLLPPDYVPWTRWSPGNTLPTIISPSERAWAELAGHLGAFFLAERQRQTDQLVTSEVLLREAALYLDRNGLAAGLADLGMRAAAPQLRYQQTPPLIVEAVVIGDESSETIEAMIVDLARPPTIAEQFWIIVLQAGAATRLVERLPDVVHGDVGQTITLSAELLGRFGAPSPVGELPSDVDRLVVGRADPTNDLGIRILRSVKDAALP